MELTAQLPPVEGDVPSQDNTVRILVPNTRTGYAFAQMIEKNIPGVTRADQGIDQGPDQGVPAPFSQPTSGPDREGVRRPNLNQAAAQPGPGGMDPAAALRQMAGGAPPPLAARRPQALNAQGPPTLQRRTSGLLRR